VALLGDAAGFLDPITGGGMTQALMSAELLAEYVVDRLGTQERWLWKFDSERQCMLRDFQILTRMVLWVADHPRLAKGLLSALGDASTVFSYLIGVSGGVSRLFDLGGEDRPGTRDQASIRCRPNVAGRVRPANKLLTRPG